MSALLCCKAATRPDCSTVARLEAAFHLEKSILFQSTRMKMTRIHRTTCLVGLVLQIPSILCFQFNSLPHPGASLRKSIRQTPTTTLHAASSDDESPAQGLVAMGSSLQSQLASAFSQLDESDQYDAILTGLCAKILDDSSLKGQDVVVALQDSIQLMEEMNARRVVAGSRSIMALVDVSARRWQNKGFGFLHF